jgi:hypothetical protein
MTWPPGQSLDDAFDKLRWAKHHLEALRVEIKPIEQRDAHTISFSADANTGKYAFYVHDLEELDDGDWSLRIGDCLHNARTALDYLMVRLFALVTGKRPRYVGRVQFPISSDLGHFADATKEARKHPAFSGYLARIEELQPFNLGNQSVWGINPDDPTMATSIFPRPRMHALPISLRRLSLLDNLDKHRVIHATWLGVRGGRTWDSRFTDPDPSFIPAAFDLRGGSTYLGALENGAEIGSMEFATPLPHEWHPDEVDMKRHFPLQVSLADEWTFADGVLEVLQLCVWGVEAVLTLFAPVFTDGAPPLPVTAIPNP